MSKKLTTFFVFVLSILFMGLLNAQDLNFTGNGARSAGMGNAFTGVADDATAMSWNSAGLTQLYAMEASAVTRFGFGSIKLDGWDDAPAIDLKSRFQINFLSFAMPFKVGSMTLVGGIAYRTLFDFNNEVIYHFDSGDETYKYEGAVGAITPAIGIKINDMISVGAALNIYTGSSKYSETYQNDPSSDYTGAKESYSGSGLDIGVLIKPTDKFSIGGNFNLPNKLKYESEGNSDELKVPLFYSVGVGYRATDQLLIAVDYQSHDWSKSDDFKDASNADLFKLNSLHLGVEYLLMKGNAVIPLRAGFYTNPLFATSDNDGNQVVDNVLTLGVGLIMNSIVIDGAFEMEPTTIKYDSYDFKQSFYRTTIGATIHFGN